MTATTTSTGSSNNSSESNNETTTKSKPPIVTPLDLTSNDEATTKAVNETTTTTTKSMSRSRLSRIIQFLLESFAVIALIAIVIHATADDNEPAKPVQSSSRDNPRMITKEELAHNNGTNGTPLWLSIMGEVYDVTVAPHFYGVNATYNIFVGRDANVPFVTGKFDEEEAAKPITSLNNNELWGVEHFLNDTYRESTKYHFIGLLIGDLYNKDGTPTPILLDVRNRIADQKIVKEEQERQRQEILAERRRKDAEKAKEEAERKQAEEERRRAIEEQIAASGEMSRIELATNGNSEL